MKGHDMLSAVARRTAIPAAVAAFALLACAACSGGAADRGSAGAGATVTVATEPAPTTTTNPYAVPAVIDVAYVNRVLAGLDAAVGDVTRLIIRTKTISPEAFDRLKALYSNNELFQLVLELLQDQIRTGFTDFKSPPGNQSTVATQLVSAGSTCIFARVQRDFAAVTVSKNPASSQWVSLRPLDKSRDPNGYNPTTWGLIYDGFTKDRSQPANPCSG
jgi:hypothetical protein